jgi:uncharacterized protein YndB with AHSA1/START domain
MQAATRNAQVTLPADDQILITREFDAPRHLVYQAWTTPELVRRWFGGNHGEYREIVPNERIVSTEVFEGAPEAESLNTLTLTERDGRTTMTVLGQHQSPANRDAVLEAGMESGMNAALDKLEHVARSLS